MTPHKASVEVPQNRQDLGITDAPTDSAQTTRQMERQHILASAGYWFKGSRNAQERGQHAEAVAFMENAYNHVENALAACNDFIRDCANGVLMRGGKTCGQRAWELLSMTGGRSPGVSVSSKTSPSPAPASLEEKRKNLGLPGGI